MKDENDMGAFSDDLHTWWELSYAQYLTVPRLAMMSMPSEWRNKMAALLKELDETIDWRPENGRYYCYLRVNGKFTKDPLSNYRRGKYLENK